MTFFLETAFKLLNVFDYLFAFLAAEFSIPGIGVLCVSDMMLGAAIGAVISVRIVKLIL